MAEIDHKGRVNEDRKLDLRDVVSAWLICALVAVVALAFSGDPRGPPASAPVVSGLIPSGGSAGYDFTKLLHVLRGYGRSERSMVWLFPGDLPGQPITARAVAKACLEACGRCGIPKRISPHSLRHSCNPPKTCSCTR